MPKVQIQETYKYSSNASDLTNFTAYIPVKVVDGVEAQEPKLYTSYKDLLYDNYYNETTELIDYTSAKIYNDQEINYAMIRKLLEKGLPVLVEGITITQDVPDIDFNRLADKALYNIRFLTLGSYIEDKATLQKLIKCAALRQDAIALLSDLEDMSEVEIESIYSEISERVGQERSYFEDLIKYTENEEEKTLSNDILKNSTAFTPWFTAKLNQIDRTYEDEQVTKAEDKEVELEVPSTFGYLSAFIDSIKQNPEWNAIAGSFRGNIKELVSVDYNYTSAEVEILQGRSKLGDVPLDNVNDNVGLAINPISKIIPFGYLINGNRTMYVNSAKEDNRPSYKAILSIRNLVCTLTKQSYFASKKYTFEPNTDITYINFQSEITPLLDRMRSGLGIRGYRFNRLATTEKGRIRALINIKPIEPVEDFDLTIELDETIDVVE